MRVRGAVRRLCEYCYVVHRRGKLFVMCKKNPKHKQRQLYTTTTAAAMQQQQQPWPSLLGGGISRGSGPQLTQEDAAELVCPNSAVFAPVRLNGPLLAARHSASLGEMFWSAGLASRR